MSKLLYVADKSAGIKFEFEDFAKTGFEVVAQYWKDGSTKTADGKLVKLDDANAKTPNLRIFCNIKITGQADALIMEVTRMNALGFDKCVDQVEAKKGLLKVKAGAKVSCAGKVFAFSM